MKTLQVTTKRKADAMLIDSLFTQGRTLQPSKYDAGKYKWTGKASDYEGRIIDNAPDNVIAIWAERRQDSDGPYAQLMCLTK